MHSSACMHGSSFSNDERRKLNSLLFCKGPGLPKLIHAGVKNGSCCMTQKWNKGCSPNDPSPLKIGVFLGQSLRMWKLYLEYCLWILLCIDKCMSSNPSANLWPLLHSWRLVTTQSLEPSAMALKQTQHLTVWRQHFGSSKHFQNGIGQKTWRAC